MPVAETSIVYSTAVLYVYILGKGPWRYRILVSLWPHHIVRSVYIHALISGGDSAPYFDQFCFTELV